MTPQPGSPQAAHSSLCAESSEAPPHRKLRCEPHEWLSTVCNHITNLSSFRSMGFHPWHMSGMKESLPPMKSIDVHRHSQPSSCWGSCSQELKWQTLQTESSWDSEKSKDVLVQKRQKYSQKHLWKALLITLQYFRYLHAGIPLQKISLTHHLTKAREWTKTHHYFLK